MSGGGCTKGERDTAKKVAKLRVKRRIGRVPRKPETALRPQAARGPWEREATRANTMAGVEGCGLDKHRLTVHRATATVRTKRETRPLAQESLAARTRFLVRCCVGSVKWRLGRMEESLPTQLVRMGREWRAVGTDSNAPICESGCGRGYRWRAKAHRGSRH